MGPLLRKGNLKPSGLEDEMKLASYRLRPGTAQGPEGSHSWRARQEAPPFKGSYNQRDYFLENRIPEQMQGDHNNGRTAQQQQDPR
jgi:hypothetical protein